MKFKVGDKVKVKTDIFRPYKKAKAGKIATVMRLDRDNAGMPSYALRFEDCKCNDMYFWHDFELEDCTAFTKSDLKDGMIVEYRRGWMELVLGGKTVDGSGSHSLCNFDDELINKDSRDSDIMRVYSINDGITNIDCIFDRACLTLIWERKEEPKPKEMTVEEIEKELGYKIKVVGDASCQK